MQKRALYHLMPQPMVGDTLSPLNTLKHLAPDAYERHRQKYAGRESLLERPIPPLNCLWNDALHLSPVHPALLRDARLKLGLPWPAKGRQIGVVDPEQIGMTRDNTVIWPYSDTRKAIMRRAATPLLPFDATLLDDLAAMPDPALRYVAEVKRTGEPPFLFVGIPHVLFRGQIKRNNIVVITV